jgi:hypothetical protein
MDLSKLLPRIEALRAKTVANGCTEAEALAAAAKVAELLDQYSLSLSDVELAREQCGRLTVPIPKKLRAAMDACIGAVAHYADCKVWKQKTPEGRAEYVFFGLPADLEMAGAICQMVEAALRSGADGYKKGRKVVSHRHDEVGSFLLGMAMGVADKLWAMKDERDRANRGSGRDLVVVKAGVVDTEFAQLGMSFRTGGPSGKQVLGGAFEAGVKAGEGVEL